MDARTGEIYTKEQLEKIAKKLEESGKPDPFPDGLHSLDNEPDPNCPVCHGRGWTKRDEEGLVKPCGCTSKSSEETSRKRYRLSEITRHNNQKSRSRQRAKAAKKARRRNRK